jgi:hypothetical protein
MSTESTTRISCASSAETYTPSAESYLEQLPPEIISKISLHLSPSDNGRLSLASTTTFGWAISMESVCRTQYREKMRRIFSVLSQNFKTNLIPQTHKIESIIDQMTLKNLLEKKSECHVEFANLLPHLSSEYLDRKNSNLDCLLFNYIHFINTESRDNLIRVILQNRSLANIMREKFAKTQQAQ